MTAPTHPATAAQPPDPPTGLGRVARGGALNLVAAAVGAALNVGVVVVVTRGFTPQAAGVFFSATSLFLILVAVANLGVGNGLVYFVARLRARGQAGWVSRLLRLAAGPVLGCSVLLAAGVALAAPVLAELLGSREAAAYLRLLALFLPLAVLADAALAATRGYQEMRATAVLDKVARPLSQLVLVGAVAASGTAGLLVVAWAGPYLPAAVLAVGWLVWLLRRERGGRGSGDGLSHAEEGHAGAGPPDARAFWGFCLPRSVANVAQIGIQRSGIVLLAVLAGAVEAALFTAATRFVVVGQFAAQAVQLAAQPRIAELLAVDDRDGTRTLYQVSTAWLVCLTWPLFLPVLAFAPTLMGLFGAGYAGGSGVLVLVAAAMLLASACGMGDLTLTMAGRTSWNLANNVAALALNVALCFALIPWLGALGAACAWTAALATRNLLPVAQLAWFLGLRPWSRAVLAAMAASGAWFGLLPLCAAALLGTGLAVLAGILTVAAVGYAATLWRLRGPLRLDVLVRRRAVGR